jgi:hypothetical protein
MSIEQSESVRGERLVSPALPSSVSQMKEVHAVSRHCSPILREILHGFLFLHVHTLIHIVLLSITHVQRSLALGYASLVS